MEVSYMTGKINTYMLVLRDKMSNWLGQRLPRITENWWNDLVYNNLSQLQRDQVDTKRVQNLEELDLAALLRVFDRNWFVITSLWFINNKERQNVKRMMEIRNAWAHIPPDQITKDKVIENVKIIIDLMQLFDADMNEIRDMETFLIDVENDIHIKSQLSIKPYDTKVMSTNSLALNEITVGSMVTLVSEPSKEGAVVAIENERYTVFMENKLQTFYKEQLQPQIKTTNSIRLSLVKVRSALTAYQINNPGSSSLYSLNAARIDFVPYQFRPALKMIKSDSPRLLVADDVGVGKTIEAGLSLKEMEARHSVKSVLIICPRPLVAERKWQLEMRRFDENFTQLDGRELQQCILEADRDGDWPDRHKNNYSIFFVRRGYACRNGIKKKKDKGFTAVRPLTSF